jgi:sulfur-carrier protein
MPLIKLFGALRKVAGLAEVQTGCRSVRQAIEALCVSNPALRDAILIGDRLRPHVRVMVNGRDVEIGAGLETPLRQGDQVAIFPPIAGG